MAVEGSVSLKMDVRNRRSIIICARRMVVEESASLRAVARRAQRQKDCALCMAEGPGARLKVDVRST